MHAEELAEEVGALTHRLAEAQQTKNRSMLQRLVAVDYSGIDAYGRPVDRESFIVKVVNGGPEPQRMDMRLSGLARAARGTVTVLSGDPLDENTFDAPTKIVPVTSPLQVPGANFTHTFPAHSLTIMRIPSR